MEEKIKALKTSSKIISVIAKICYTVMIVAVCISAFLLIFIAVTGGEISNFKVGGTNVIIFNEKAYSPAELTSICAVLIVIGAFLLSIFMLTYRMFNNISLTGEPFTIKHVKTVRVIGILTAAMPIVVGIVEGFVSVFTKTEVTKMYTNVPGIVVGAIIFCLSYIIDYGCGLKSKSEENN